MSFLEQLEDPRGRTSGPSVAGTRLAGELLEDEQRNLQLAQLVSVGEVAQLEESFRNTGQAGRNRLNSMVNRWAPSINQAVVSCAEVSVWQPALLAVANAAQCGLFSPTIYTYNSLATACLRCHAWSWGLLLLGDARSKGLRLDAFSAASAFSSCQTEKQWQVTSKILQSLRVGEDEGVALDLVVASSAMTSFEKGDRWQDAIFRTPALRPPCSDWWPGAFALLQQMGTAALRPNAVSYQAALSSTKETWRCALSSFRFMEREGIKWTVLGCEHVIRACEHRGELGVVRQLLELVRKKNDWAIGRPRSRWRKASPGRRRPPRELRKKGSLGFERPRGPLGIQETSETSLTSEQQRLVESKRDGVTPPPVTCAAGRRVAAMAISNKKLQKIMTLPINQIFRYLQNRSRVQVWLHEQADLRIEGRILGFDEYMNLVIDDAEEIMVKKKTRRAIGRILLKVAQEPQALSLPAFRQWQRRIARHRQHLIAAKEVTDISQYEREERAHWVRGTGQWSSCEVQELERASAAHKSSRKAQKREEEAKLKKDNVRLVQKLCDVARQSEKRQEAISARSDPAGASPKAAGDFRRQLGAVASAGDGAFGGAFGLTGRGVALQTSGDRCTFVSVAPSSWDGTSSPSSRETVWTAAASRPWGS
eukprot:g30454.t1